MANSALWQHYPNLPRQLPQPHGHDQPQTLVQLRASGLLNASGGVVPKFYAAYYAGDYDASAWLYSQVRGAPTAL
jgi:hypothetical protein